MRFVDISYFENSGQLFIRMYMYAFQTNAAKSISTNMNGAFAGQKVYSKSAENGTKKTTIKSSYHHIILKFYSSSKLSVLEYVHDVYQRKA